MNLKTLITSVKPSDEELREIVKATVSNDLAVLSKWKSILSARYALDCFEALLVAELENPPINPPEVNHGTKFEAILWNVNASLRRIRSTLRLA